MYSEYVIPTERLLDNLGPGCFVEVEEGDNAVWVEINDTNGEVYWGKVHANLCESACPYDDQETVVFVRDQISHLGCDRYCFC